MPLKITDQEVQEEVYQALVPLLKKFWDDKQAFSQLGPTLLSGAVYLMVQDIGEAFAVRVLNEMADRVARGEFSGLAGGLGKVLQ